MKFQKFFNFLLIGLMILVPIILFTQGAQAAPDLAVGDIALILYNSDDTDGIAFVTLANIAAGEEVFFTDNGWLSSGGFRNNEGIMKWTAPVGGVPAGTIVSVSSPWNTGDWSQVSGGGPNLSASGDQILVYQGSLTTPTMIYALNNEGNGWQANAVDSNTSALPTGLTNGTTAIALDEIDNAKLNCTSAQTGTKENLLSFISNKANWVGSDTEVQTLDSGCSFTITAGDTPPTVQSTVPSDSATGVSVDTTLTITFSEPVTVTGTWFDVTCVNSGGHPAAVTGGDESFILTPNSAFSPGETCTVTVYAAQVTDKDGTTNNPMASDFAFSFTTQDGCGGPYTRIHNIQGSGLDVALTGEHIVEGVVTHLAPDLRGFYLQSLAPDWDTDDTTSEGLFVYDAGLSTSLMVGDHIRLKGTTSDYTGSYGNAARMTQMSSITESQVCQTDVSVNPVTLNFPITGDPATYLERYEGMLVTIPQTLTVQQNYFQGRFGQLTLGSGGRVFTHLNGMGGDYLSNLQRLIVLDDSSTAQNPDPISYYPHDGALRAGDSVSGITGVLDQGRINSSNPYNPAELVFPNVYYRIHPTTPPVFTIENPRTSAPDEHDGYLKVASFNVLNYFTTLDQPPFPSDWPYHSGARPRGADNYDELIRQERKLAQAIIGLDADVIGLVEIEAWDEAVAPEALARLINVELRMDVFTAGPDPFNTEFDLIQQAFIYNQTAVTPIGDPEILTVTPFDTYRPPLAQLFQDNKTKETFWVIINHFKSKNCYGSETGGDIDLGMGIGCYNETRMAMSTELVTWINTVLSPVDPDVLVIGDLNSYGGEAPIQTLVVGGLLDQIEAHVPENQRYSYIFDGMSGYLEQALSTPSMDRYTNGVSIWHINIDEPSIIDYNTEFKTVDLYQPHPYRSSDHDPVVITLDFQYLKYHLPVFYR